MKSKRKNEDVLSVIHTSFNDKAQCFIKKLHDKYEEDENFFLQRHELSRLMVLLTKDSVLVAESPSFYYNNKRYSVGQLDSEANYTNLVQMNHIFIIQDIVRSETGNINYIGKIMI